MSDIGQGGVLSGWWEGVLEVAEENSDGDADDTSDAASGSKS